MFLSPRPIWGGGTANDADDSIILSTDGDNSNLIDVTTADDLKTKLADGISVVLKNNLTLTGSEPITITNKESQPTTLDLGGHTLTINEINSSNSNRLIVTDANVVIKNGTIVYNASGASKSGQSPIKLGSSVSNGLTHGGQNSSILTLSEVNIISQDYGVAVFAKANLTVNNSSIIAKTSAISTVGNPPNGGASSCDSVISINGGSYTSLDSAAIYFPGGDSLTVNGGTFTGKTGFDLRSGTTKITDATINVLGSQNEQKLQDNGEIDGDGPTPWGMGIAVFDKEIYGKVLNEYNVAEYGAIDVTVSSSTKIINAVYDLYVGDYKIISAEGDNLGKFDKSNLNQQFAACHTVTVKYADDSPYTAASESNNSPKVVDGDRVSDDAILSITMEVNRIFANGTAITISAGTDNDSKITYGNKTFIDNFDLSKYTIYGGAKNAAVDSSSITMAGGTVKYLYGGGLGSEATSATVDTASIEITGGTITATVYAGGNHYSTVDAATVNISGNAVCNDVMAGGANDSSAKDNTNKPTSANLVKNVTINVSGGTIGTKENYSGLYGGGMSYAHVENSTLNVSGGKINLLVAGGSNGVTDSSTINISGSTTINYLFSVNRGVIEDSTLNVEENFTGTIGIIALGALSDWDDDGKNISQFKGGSTDGAVIGSVTLNVKCAELNASDGKTQVFLGRGLYSNYGNSEFTCDDASYYQHYAYSAAGSLDGAKALETPVSANVTVSGNVNVIAYVGNTTNTYDPTTFVIGEGKEWTFENGAALEIPAGNNILATGTFTNNGTIEVSDEAGLATAAAIGGNIKLLNNITIENQTTFLILVDGTILDLNNKTISMSKTCDENKNSINRLLVNNGKVIIKNGTLNDTATTSDRSPVIVSAGSGKGGSGIPQLTLNNVIITSDCEYGVVVFEGKLIVNDSSITAKYSAISGNGTMSGSYVELNDGTYTSTDYAVIFFPSTTNLKVNGGKFIGPTGFDIRAGTVDINNAVINIKNVENDGVTGTSGPSNWKMGIAVIDHESYNYTGTGDSKTYLRISVTISKTNVNDADYGLYIGNLNRAENGSFQGSEGKFTQYHDISVIVNGKTVSSEASADKSVKDKDYFTSDVKYSSGGGSGTPITPPTPPVVPEEPIVPDDKGNAEIKVDEKKAEELVHEAVTSGSNSVTLVDKENIEGTVTSVTIPVSDLETISKQIENNENVNSVSIATSVGEVIIEKEVLNDIIENANAETIVVEVVDAKDQLNEEQKKTVGDNPVYDVNIRAGSEYIKSFNGKTITVSIPYELQPGEDPNNLVVYYLKDDGTVEKMKGTYKDGQVSFETDHLSKFVIAYEAQEPVTPDNPDKPAKEDNDNTIYYIVAAIVVILIIVALAYYFLKKKQ